jgi:acetyl-CoA acyltransferase
MGTEREPVIVAAVRTAVGKAPRGTLRQTRPDEMAAAVLRGCLEEAKGLDPADVDDVIMGCAFPEGPQGMNVGRVASLRAGLPDAVPGMTLNRFCASGLEAIALAADRIRSGQCDVVLAGGTESMSLVPMGGATFSPNPELARELPDAYLNMGLTAERVAERFGIGRAEQDAFALESHRRAIRAQDEGIFADEILPLEVTRRVPGPEGGTKVERIRFDRDEGPRRDTSLEALAGLRPVFKEGGTVTAGNASQMSDGAAACLLVERRRAEQLGLKPLAAFRGYAVAGVPPEIMGIGPVRAIPRLLERVGLKLQEVDLFEINEAFAAQIVYVLRELGIPQERVNPLGGAIALGHPLGATGARLAVTLVRSLQRTGGRFGIVSMCIGGGMGAAGLLERL